MFKKMLEMLKKKSKTSSGKPFPTPPAGKYSHRPPALSKPSQISALTKANPPSSPTPSGKKYSLNTCLPPHPPSRPPSPPKTATTNPKYHRPITADKTALWQKNPPRQKPSISETKHLNLLKESARIK